MAGLRFRIRDFRDELDSLIDIASSFLAADGEAVLRDLLQQVDSLWSSGEGSTRPLEIRRAWPLRTRHTNGAYEHDGGGTFATLHGVVSAVWEVRTLGAQRKIPGGDRAFEIAGKASTVLEIWVDYEEAVTPEGGLAGKPRKIASWRLEVANADAPGPVFHAQVPDSSADEAAVDLCGLWPHWLAVPRLHVGPFTPMAAIEFLLSELFQAEWAHHVLDAGAQASTVNRWAKLQQMRARAFLEWQLDVVTRLEGGTPIVAMKVGVPADTIFI